MAFMNEAYENHVLADEGKRRVNTSTDDVDSKLVYIIGEEWIECESQISFNVCDHIVVCIVWNSHVSCSLRW